LRREKEKQEELEREAEFERLRKIEYEEYMIEYTA